MKKFKDFLNESDDSYIVKFRKAGARTSVQVFSGSKDDCIKYVDNNYPDYTIYDDFGGSFAGGDGRYLGKASGRNSGEVSILPSSFA